MKATIYVDSRGRTSLARVRSKMYDRYLAVEYEDGSIVLSPLVTIPASELAELGAGADARKLVAATA